MSAPSSSIIFTYFVKTMKKMLFKIYPNKPISKTLSSNDLRERPTQGTSGFYRSRLS